MDEEDFLFSDAECSFDELAQFGGRLGSDFEADCRTAPAALQCALELADEVFRLFFNFHVAIADDAESALPAHRIAREQATDEQSDCRFERNEARSALLPLRKTKEPLDLRRHANEGVHSAAVALADQLQGKREAEVRDEGEWMRRVDGERRQNRKHMVQKVILEPTTLAL